MEWSRRSSLWVLLLFDLLEQKTNTLDRPTIEGTLPFGSDIILGLRAQDVNELKQEPHRHIDGEVDSMLNDARGI